METIYSSKIDAWLVTVIVAAAIGLLILAWVLSRSRGMTGIMMMLPAFLGAIGLPVWLMIDTRYTLNSTELFIKSGPVSIQLSIADITAITPTRDARSSPALSLDRLRIDYGDNESVMISPKAKAEFLEDLEARRAALAQQ